MEVITQYNLMELEMGSAPSPPPTSTRGGQSPNASKCLAESDLVTKRVLGLCVYICIGFNKR